VNRDRERNYVPTNRDRKRNFELDAKDATNAKESGKSNVKFQVLNSDSSDEQVHRMRRFVF